MKKNKNLLCGILLLSSFSAIAMEPSQSNSSSNSSIYFEIGTGVSMNSGKDAVNDYELNFNESLYLPKKENKSKKIIMMTVVTPTVTTKRT